MLGSFTGILIGANVKHYLNAYSVVTCSLVELAQPPFAQSRKGREKKKAFLYIEVSSDLLVKLHPTISLGTNQLYFIYSLCLEIPLYMYSTLLSCLLVAVSNYREFPLALDLGCGRGHVTKQIDDRDLVQHIVQSEYASGPLVSPFTESLVTRVL